MVRETVAAQHQRGYTMTDVDWTGSRRASLRIATPTGESPVPIAPYGATGLLGRWGRCPCWPAR